MGLMVETGALHAPRPGTGAASCAPIPDAVLAALTADDSSSFHAQIVQQCLDLDSFFVWTDPKSGVVCLRSPTQLAAFYAATGCLAVLLALGADVSQQSPDDQTTALHAACSGCSSSNTTLAIRSLLNAGARLDVLDKYGRTPRDLLPLEAAQAAPEEDQMQKDCFRTDDFRMYSFKVELCQRLDEQHDWTTCPFMHPGEKARRRNPRTHKYDGVPCPDFRKGTCKRGDACTYAHGVFECWLHPARYRTQLCKEGALCKRSVCFFAHSMDELREPLYLHGEPGKAHSPTPDSPKGPLAPGEASTETISSRASSPDPSPPPGFAGIRGCMPHRAYSADMDVATSALRTPTAAAPLGAGGRASRDPRRGSASGARGDGSKLMRVSSDSLRSVLSRSMSGSADSSLSSTPVLESTLARSFSNLSVMSHDDTVAAAAAAAAAAVAAMGASPGTLCSPGGPWGLPGGMQVHPNDMLSYQMAAAGLLGYPAYPGQSASLLGHQQAAALQAATLQQQLAMSQAPLDTTAALLAAAGLREPLQNLPLNLQYQAGQNPAFPSCFGM
ncbi:hypothetical protein N2152v2_002762 [Parachlorella kessleri]